MISYQVFRVDLVWECIFLYDILIPRPEKKQMFEQICH